MWDCTLVVADAGRVVIQHYRLLELPEARSGSGYVGFVTVSYPSGDRSFRSWLATSIRTMELKPAQP